MQVVPTQDQFLACMSMFMWTILADKGELAPHPTRKQAYPGASAQQGWHAGKGKALAWAGVPSRLCKQLSAGDWVKGPLAALGGKGGGKPSSAQGQGPYIDKLPEAMKAADEYARTKLS